MEPMLQLNRVSKRYIDGNKALNQISFTLNKGEMVFITGHSGAGKSTLLRVIAAIDPHSQGQIIFNGKNYNHLTTKDIPFLRRQFGLIFQNPHLLHDRNVFNNVALPLIINGLPYREVGRKVRAALDKVALLKKENDLPSALSTGEQQRVGIARAIVNKPPLLLADEPTGNLDPELSREIMDLFRQFNHVGVSALIVSHDLELITQLSYRMLLLQEGALQESMSCH